MRSAILDAASRVVASTVAHLILRSFSRSCSTWLALGSVIGCLSLARFRSCLREALAEGDPEARSGRRRGRSGAPDTASCGLIGGASPRIRGHAGKLCTRRSRARAQLRRVCVGLRTQKADPGSGEPRAARGGVGAGELGSCYGGGQRGAVSARSAAPGLRSSTSAAVRRAGSQHSAIRSPFLVLVPAAG
jgi:hypothetical protein